MARMYPEDIENYEPASDEEKHVFRFLKEAPRPHKDFICWYKPFIGPPGRMPDFMLFGKKLGLMVFEVKDWSLSQIISATPHRFTIRLSGKDEKIENPDKQAKQYIHTLMEKLERIPDFLSDLPPHERRLKIPIGRIVVFPNIQRDAYCRRGIQWLIPIERVLFYDDIKASGKILADLSGLMFYERISAAFPFRFKGLTQKEIYKLVFVISPESKIELPQRKGSGKTTFHREIQALDEAQARLALHLGSGHQIIKGPPGSGKTLVLVHRCCHLIRYSPGVKRILLVCYNIALVSYLKRLISKKGEKIEGAGIHVCHFFELCSEILGKSVHFENEEAVYYDRVTHEAREKLAKRKSPIEPFDAVFVDEGQDFNNEMLKTLLALLRPEGDLVISLDAHQDLYKRKGSWKSIGIRASGRTHYLNKVYRNTAEIFEFSKRFLGETPVSGQQLDLLPKGFAFHGDLPELRRFQNHEDAETFLAEDLCGWIDRQVYKRSEIAVLYDDKVYGTSRFAYDNRALPMRILKKLESSGIPSTWVSQDVRAKEMFDVTTDRVSLISIHSAKGLDFDLVYLMGADHIPPPEKTKKNLLSLIYVAMTRAKHRLIIPYVEETEIIRRMKKCLP
jgi:hypothetical protein